MHTHATEAYQMDGEDVYQESDDSRTTDENYNMIRVGEEMKAVFEDMGLSVVHDKTTYDYPGYNGSYGRSLAGIQSYLEQYPTIGVVLDVHRDALIDSDGTVYSKTTTIDGEQVAQVMLVVGTNDSGLSHPNWQDNFTLSLKLQGAMLTVADSLPRAIDLRSQRFNQHLTAGSLLVEVGTSGNTLQEALAGARLFAQAAGQVYTNCIVDKD
jgi:stage II sporulation protein P